VDQAKAFGMLIASARAWVVARTRLRRAMDSKKARPEDVEAARKVVGKASADLEAAVRRFDQSVKTPHNGRSNLNLGDIAGAVAKVAGGIEQAVRARKGGPVRVEVIDTDGETV